MHHHHQFSHYRPLIPLLALLLLGGSTLFAQSDEPSPVDNAPQPVQSVDAGPADALSNDPDNRDVSSSPTPTATATPTEIPVDAITLPAPTTWVEDQPMPTELPTNDPLPLPDEADTTALPPPLPAEVQPTLDVAPPMDPEPVLPTVVTVPPEPILPPVAPPIGLPFHERFDSGTGWRPDGAWAFTDTEGVRAWVADTSSRIPDMTLEFETPVALTGVAHPQLVMRQMGTLSSADIVLVEFMSENGTGWASVDQQIGAAISGEWSARFVDLAAWNGQTVRVRLHILSMPQVPPGEQSRHYQVDELVIQEYVTPPAPAPILNPVQPTVPPQTAPPTFPPEAHVQPVQPVQPTLIPTDPPVIVPTQADAIPLQPPTATQERIILEPTIIMVDPSVALSGNLESSMERAPVSAQLFSSAALPTGSGLTGEYYDNRDLTNLKLTRIDPTVNFDWGTGSPDPAIYRETFSIRWTGQVVPLFTETYTFSTVSDDGVRLWVNGQRIIDDWNYHGPQERQGSIALVGGQAYDIRLEYFDGGSGATVALSWASPSQTRQIVPPSQLFPRLDTNPGQPGPVIPTATTPPTTTPPPTMTPLPTTMPLPSATQIPTSESELDLPSQELAWAPPDLVNPITINVPANQTRRFVARMDADKDYIIRMPSTPLRAGLALVGGRNVVVIGGEISIPWQSEGTIASRTMLLIRDATGTVHIEGLQGGGADISEGIQIDAPNAIVQLQNIRIDNIHARDQVGFSDNHPDLIQTYGNVRELRVDRFTGSSDYQGVLLKADYDKPHGQVIIRRMNIIGLPTARYLWWAHPQSGAAQVTLENVWIDVPAQRAGGLGRAVWPDVNGRSPNQATVQTDATGQFATWDSAMVPRVVGRIYEGRPPGGDFVPAGSVGLNYRGG